MNSDVTPLADAVSSAINAAADQASQVAQATTDAITQSLGTYTNGLFDWAKSIFSWLKDNISTILSTIGKTLKDIGKAIYDQIAAIIGDISKFYKNTIGPILENIGTAIQKVVDFYKQHIQPILSAVSAAIEVIAKATIAIEKDIQGGLAGILQLPTDLANAFSGIDQALIRAGRALGTISADKADTWFKTDDSKSLADHVRSLHLAVSGLGITKEQTTFSPGQEKLTEPTLAEELPKLLDAMNTIVFDVAKGLKNIALDPKKLAESAGIAFAAFWAGLMEPMEVLLALWEIMKAPLGVVGELAEERVREVVKLTKLDSGTLTAAWVRSLITTEAMDEELAVQGYDKNRTELLRRLSRHVEDTGTLLDYRYRGIVTDADFSNGLSDLGFTESQKRAYLEGSIRVLDVTTALEAFRRDFIDEATLDEVIRVNRFTSDQATLLKSMNLAGADYDSAYRAYLETRMQERIGIQQTGDLGIPPAVKDAGRRQGLSEAAIDAKWVSQVNSLPSTLWLSLYWRGQASLEELRNALFRDRVPEALWQNWIDSQRPLIPFRTVPAMVAAGIFSESEALAYLEKHGYSQVDAVRLLQYATRGTKKAKATTAVAQHDLSLAQAKTAYEDGLLTKDQYMQLLTAHGLDTNAAVLEVKLADIATEIKARKQIGIDLVNEYQAGLIDHAQALQELSSSGYTLAEQAAIQKKLKTAGAAKAKTPSEAELRAMAKHDVIDTQTYYDSLVTLGFSTTWSQRFRDLYFPADASTAAGDAVGG